MDAEKTAGEDRHPGHDDGGGICQGQQGARQHGGDSTPDHEAAAEPLHQAAHQGRAERAEKVDQKDQADCRLTVTVGLPQQTEADVIVDADEAPHAEEGHPEQAEHAGVFEVIEQ